MKFTEVNCAEIRNRFARGEVPGGPAVEAHLESCPHCSVLLEKGARLGRLLGEVAPMEIKLGDLFESVSRDLAREVGPRAWLRALPTRIRVAGLAGAAGLLLTLQLWLRRRPDFEVYSPVVFWAVLFTYGVALAFGTRRLLRGISSPIETEVRACRVTLSLLMLPTFVALVVPLGSAEAATGWATPGSCFAYGALVVAPLPVLALLFERRDSAPLNAVAITGALSGIAANLLLHARCPFVHLGHLLLGHASIGVVWSLALGLLSRRPKRPASTRAR